MSVRTDFEAYFLKLYGRRVGSRAGNIYFDDMESAAWCAWEASHMATSTDCHVQVLRNSLQPNERAVLDALVSAWNLYLDLSKAHPDQDAEFRHGIHALQHQIMARPTRRMLNGETK